MFYLGLALAGLIGAGITYQQSERKAELLVLLAFAAAVVTAADWIAFGVLALYNYSPGLASDPLIDAALGEVLADLVFVPCLAMTLAARVSGLPGMLIGTFVVTALEVIMGAMGIYFGTGWVIGFTAIGFLVYFAGLDLFWHDMVHGTLPWSRIRLIVRGALVLESLAVLTLFLRARQYVVTHITVMSTQVGDQALGRLLTYGLTAGALGYWALCGQGAGRWLRLGLVTVGLLLFNFILSALSIQHFQPPWSATADALAQGAAIGLAGLAEDGIMRLHRSRARRRL